MAMRKAPPSAIATMTEIDMVKGSVVTLKSSTSTTVGSCVVVPLTVVGDDGVVSSVACIDGVLEYVLVVFTVALLVGSEGVSVDGAVGVINCCTELAGPSPALVLALM